MYANYLPVVHQCLMVASYDKLGEQLYHFNLAKQASNSIANFDDVSLDLKLLLTVVEKSRANHLRCISLTILALSLACLHCLTSKLFT